MLRATVGSWEGGRPQQALVGFTLRTSRAQSGVLNEKQIRGLWEGKPPIEEHEGRTPSVGT